MEIASGVHAVPLIGATGHLIVDDRLTLIDAGLPGSSRRLKRYLAKLGRSIGPGRRGRGAAEEVIRGRIGA